MKKNLFYVFALICSMSLFAACSNDDSTPTDYTQVIDDEIAGSYKGELKVNVMGNDMPVVPQKITVEKASTTAINLFISDFSFMNIPVGDVNLKNCELTQNGNAYTFAGTTIVNVDAVGLEANVEGQGTVANGTLSLNLNITAVLGTMEQEVKVTFDGTKLNGTENTKADIIAFTFDNTDAVTEQPVINADKTITFKVAEGADVTALVPTITVSEGATVTPATGVAQDFSKGAVTYTVVSEDYGTTNTYQVSVSASQSFLKFSFEDWETGDKNDDLLPKELWASSAAGASILGGTLLKQEVNEDGSFAAKLITFEYPSNPTSLIPKITAGSIFIGTFDVIPAIMGDRLSCTKFGLPVATVGLNGQPVRLKGMYKYQAGETYLDASDYTNVVETGDVDKGSIVAVLYKAKDAEGNEVTLTGHDVNTSEYIVGFASIITENAAEYTPFDVEFTYTNGYDPEGEYKFAIVCSSSKDGDQFKGAGNSTLIVDELEVVAE